jgi:HD-like signal output (HDOD) protein
MLIEWFDMTKQEIISAIEREIDNLPPIPKILQKLDSQ